MNRGTVLVLCAALLVLIVGAGCKPRPSGDAFPYPEVGDVATFQAYPRWGIGGTVTVVDARTLRVDDFSFHGEELSVVIALQRDSTVVAILKDISSERYDRASMTFPIPEGITLQDFNLVTVFARVLGTPVSAASFRAGG